MHLPNQLIHQHRRLFRTALAVIIVGAVVATSILSQQLFTERQRLFTEKSALTASQQQLEVQLSSVSAQLAVAASEAAALKADDQFVKNKVLEEEIANIQTSYGQAVKAYEDVLDLRGDGAKTQALEDGFSKVLSLLGKRNYGEASTSLQKLAKDISLLQSQLATASAVIPTNVPVSNTAPSSGSSKQTVNTDAGQFVVDLVAGDLNSTRVQVETASEGTCGDNCPVASLSDFVSRSGGYAGINGPYFCPASYPSCAGKTNSFDTLIMNKHKVFFNSDNNVYSTVPAFVFSGNQGRLMKSAEVSRDGGVDAVIAAQPALVWGGEVVFGGDGDPKKGSRGNRSFIAVKDSTVYIGVVRNATVAETARVLKALGMLHALNLDSGGSTALMVNGKYLAGPGRQTPFGIVLVRK